MNYKFKASLKFHLFSFLLGLLVLFHFSVILIDQMPDNPISIQTRPFVKSYMNPLWVQTWTLFAPEPVSTDNSVLYQFEYLSGDSTILTEIHDVTEPLMLHRRHYYWTNTQRIQKILHGSAVSVLGITPTSADSADFVGNGFKSTSKIASNYNKSFEDRIVRSKGYEALAQYGKVVSSEVIKDTSMFKANNLCAVKIFLMSSRFPRFSERNSLQYDSLYKHSVSALPDYQVF